MRPGWRDLFVGGALFASLAVADAAQANPTPGAPRKTTASATPRKTAAPGAPSTTPAPSTPREQIPEALAESVEVPELPAVPRALPASKGRCVLHPAAPRAECADRPAALTALAGALAPKDVRARDRALAALEDCTSLPPGLVRTLRADLDRQCTDFLAAPTLAKPPAGMTAEMRAALLGLAEAARLERAVTPMPKIRGAISPATIDVFIAGAATRWLEANTKRLEELAGPAVPGPSYGALEARVAEARAWAQLARNARAAIIPAALKKNAEYRARYYGAIDILVAPIRKRAVELAEQVLPLVAGVGALDGTVAGWARALGSLEEGRHLRSLWQLYLPIELALEERPEAEARRLEALLPSFYAGLLVDPPVNDARALRALLPHGLSPAHRRALRDAPLGPEQRALLGHHYVALALRTFSPVLIAEAKRALAGVTTPGEARLWLAVAESLEATHGSFADWVAPAPPAVDATPLRRLFEGPAVDALVGGIARLDAAIMESAGKLDSLATKRLLEDVTAVHTRSLDVLQPCVEDVFGHSAVHLGGPKCPYRNVL